MSQDASSVTPALLPCPLCAGEARVAKPYGIEAVICRDCHLTITDHDQQSAVAKWNRRPTLPLEEHEVTDEFLDRQVEKARLTVETVRLERKVREVRHVLHAAEALLGWTEAKHRPPVREEIPVGAMALVRVHALADLHDAVKVALND